MFQHALLVSCPNISPALISHMRGKWQAVCQLRISHTRFIGFMSREYVCHSFHMINSFKRKSSTTGSVTVVCWHEVISNSCSIKDWWSYPYHWIIWVPSRKMWSSVRSSVEMHVDRLLSIHKRELSLHDRRIVSSAMFLLDEYTPIIRMNRKALSLKKRISPNSFLKKKEALVFIISFLFNFFEYFSLNVIVFIKIFAYYK